MNKLKVFSPKVGIPVLAGSIGGTIQNARQPALASAWSNGVWNNYDSWMNNGWNNYDNWTNNGWNNYDSWMNSGWNNYDGWSNSGWSNYDGGK